MTIGTHGTAFTSYDVETNYKTQEEIDKEKVSFDETVSQTHEVEEVVYHTTTQIDGAKATTFIDPVTKKYAIVSLENETLDKLRGKFGEDDVIKKEDGSIRLTGDAEAFVSGWFADIAYSRNFLKADANNDGQLSEDEYKNTFNNFGVEGMAITERKGGNEELIAVSEKIVQSYGLASNESGYVNYREYDKAISLDDELNTTIQIDNNFDSEMSLDEAYSTKEDKNAQAVMTRHFEEFIKSIGDIDEYNVEMDKNSKNFNKLLNEENIENFDLNINFILDLFMQKDQKEQDRIIEKLLQLKEDNKEEPSIDVMDKVYTQEHLQRITQAQKDAKENNGLHLKTYSK
ncbi:MAG: hypothetical protein DRG78_01705 [Epsilonproteobacteria bacterium]|nr:MAG: hypothetical protein DRG78_01705 [Campylobacterota bacterium]